MRTILLACFMLLCSCCFCQYQQRVKEFNNQIDQAGNQVEKKILAIGELAEYYRVFMDQKKADSLLKIQIGLAESSTDKEIMKSVFFNPTIINLGSWTSTNTFDIALSFLKKGLEYAYTMGPDYEATAHVRLANIYRKKGDLSKAQTELMAVSPLLLHLYADSIKVVYFLELGDLHAATGNVKEASRSYSEAFRESYAINSTRLRSQTFYRLSDLYKKLGDTTKANEQLQLSLAMNAKAKDSVGLFWDYLYMASLNDNLYDIDQVNEIAKALKPIKYKLHAQRLKYYWCMIKGGDSQKTLQYLKDHPDLNQYYCNQGDETCNWNMGDIYKYSGKPDSALPFYLMAHNMLTKKFGENQNIGILLSIALTYLQKHDTAAALPYYEQVHELARKNKNLQALDTLTPHIIQLYTAQKNFKKATETYAASIGESREWAAKNKIQSVVLDAVMRDEMGRKYEETRHHNLQYMSITLCIAFVFLAMLMVGMFPVNELTIKTFGYIAFVCLFEFFVLLIDHFLHDTLLLQPLGVWIAKVVIIALMVPLQHFLEHKVVKYMAKRKRIDIKTFFLSRLRFNKKARPENQEPGGGEMSTS